MSGTAISKRPINSRNRNGPIYKKQVRIIYSVELTVDIDSKDVEQGEYSSFQEYLQDLRKAMESKESCDLLSDLKSTGDLISEKVQVEEV